jgi:glycosyltransferase involved in cell wall biosynthesis
VQDEFGGMSLKPVAIPFPVDVQRFCPSELPSQPRYDCFVYFKGRKQELLEFAEATLKSLGLRYTILRYGSYTEEEYLDVLRSSKVGLWIGSHESQGFALQEALSANVPLLVWNVKSMFDEYNRANEISYKEDQLKYKLKATSVPYWDSRCGELFYEKEEFSTKLMTILQKYEEYHPRAFILETLSPVACYKRLTEILTTIPMNH